MKKIRLSAILLSVLAILCSTFIFMACGGGNNNNSPSPTKLMAPTVVLIDDTATWDANVFADRFEISIDGNLSYIENSITSRKLSDGQTFKIRAIGDGTNYTNSDWSNSVTYERPIPKYTITWKNGDTVLKTDTEVKEGTVPTYDGEDPTKPSDAQYSYVFAGWTPEVVAANENATYTAVFTSVLNKYTVTWMNDGAILEVDEDVPYGTTPVYDGATPTKASDNENDYVFIGWGPTISQVVGDIVYVAQFTTMTNKHTVTFKDWDGTIFEEEGQEIKLIVDNGTALDIEDLIQPEREGYRFDGWENWTDIVYSDVCLVAKYVKQYTIEFLDYDGSIILAYNVDEGTDAEIIPEEPFREYYRFTGWDVKDFKNIESDLIVKATYVRLYEIVFVDYDGTEFSKQDVASNEDGSFPLTNPEREGYTFIGWEGSVENVTEDRDIIARYEINSYKVTFKDIDGSVLSVQDVIYLVSATPPNVKEFYYDYAEDKGYRFTGWDKSYKEIRQDTVITAVYNEEITAPIIFIEKINSVSRKDETVKISVMIHCDFIIYGVSLDVKFADKTMLTTEVNGEYCKTGENLNYTEAISKDNIYEFRWSDTNGINFADSKVTETGTITIITFTFTWDSSSVSAGQKEIKILEDSYIINDELKKQTPVIISSVIDIVN